MTPLPEAPGAYAIAAACCAITGLLCLLAATITAICDHRKERRAMRTLTAPTATDDDPRRSPDWCWTHGCPISQCSPRH